MMTLEKKLIAKILILSTGLLSTLSFASGFDNTTKMVSGYTVDCYSQGDLDNQSRYTGYSAFNFCKPQSVNMILQKAKEIKEPNYAGDLKLIKITPTKLPSKQDYSDYALISIVDEKAKKIMVSNFVYSVYSNKDKAVKLGKVYADKNSFLFSFENPDWKNKEVTLTVHGGEGYADYTTDFLMGAFIGENKKATKGGVLPRHEFIAFSDYEDPTVYSIKNKRYIETNSWFRTYKERADESLVLHRTFSEVMGKHKVLRNWE